MKVTRFPKDPGPAAWNAILPPPETAQPLDAAISADWLVIGAGFTGLAAARRLSQLHPDARIVLLDAVRVGDGPSGRNSGFMIDLPHDLASSNYTGAADRDRAQITANRTAIDFAARAAADYGLPEEAFNPCGKINAAATAKGVAHTKDYAAHLAGLGEAHELLDAAQMQAITGTDYYMGGLFTPGAAMLQPAMFVRGVAVGLRSNRIAVYENSAVQAFDRSEGIWVARTAQGQVRAPKAILAVNGHANSFGFFERRLVHVFTYGSMTRALTPEEVKRLGGKPTWGLTPADPLGTTVRRISGTGGDRIIVRNSVTYNPGMEPPEGSLERINREHDKCFTARFPVLKGVEMEHRWGGRLCLSLNDVSAFGEVENGLFAACCQNGLGLSRGTFSGIAVAELASGLETENTRHLCAQDAPKRLPPEPFSWIGATAKLRWGERMAGRDF